MGILIIWFLPFLKVTSHLVFLMVNKMNSECSKDFSPVTMREELGKKKTFCSLGNKLLFQTSHMS